MRFPAPVLMLAIITPVSLFPPTALHAGEPAVEESVRVENAWIREAPPVAKVNAGYFSICNDNASDIILTGVSSPAFANIEMHETIEDEHSSRMQRLVSVTVPASECIAFEPGGRHLMLLNASERVAAGDSVQLRFEFAQTTSLNIPGLDILVSVRRGDTQPGVRDHKHH